MVNQLAARRITLMVKSRTPYRLEYAADDGAALHFIGRKLRRVVTSRPGAKAYRVGKVGREVVERELEAKLPGGAVSGFVDGDAYDVEICDYH